jgi:hypothetical protein
MIMRNICQGCCFDLHLYLACVNTEQIQFKFYLVEPISLSLFNRFMTTRWLGISYLEYVPFSLRVGIYTIFFCQHSTDAVNICSESNFFFYENSRWIVISP